MAKMTIEGVTYEGTPEELAGIVREFTKIQAEPKQPNFNEGDRVKMLVDGEFGDIKAGEYGVIEDLDCGFGDDPYTIDVETDEGISCYFRPQDLELAPEAKPESEPLKVGDYVVSTSASAYNYTNTDMTLGEVIDSFGDGAVTVKIIAHTKASRIGDSYGVDAKYFRKATEAEVAAAKPKPQTGDIVVITANTNSSRNKVGDIGKLTITEYGNFRVDVAHRPYSHSANGNITLETEMRLATPAEIDKYEASLVQIARDAVFSEAGRKPNEYRKGDVVRVIDSPCASPVGTIFEVETVNSDGKVNESSGYIYASRHVEIVCFAENRADAKEVA